MISGLGIGSEVSVNVQDHSPIRDFKTSPGELEVKRIKDFIEYDAINIITPCPSPKEVAAVIFNSLVTKPRRKDKGIPEQWT